MARLISKCPRCRKINEVKDTGYLRGDRGIGVTCEKCFLRFCATLSKEDETALYGGNTIFPIIKGNDDYMLKSIYYPG